MKFTYCLIALVYCNVNAFSQKKSATPVPSISEIIFPAIFETKNNFSLFHEVHIARDKVRTPSFWYKIIFNVDCSFEFTLYPLEDNDSYDFYLYKIEGNEVFCEASNDNKVISLNHYKLLEENTDNQQSKNGSNTVNVNPIPVKSGDAIYLEVISSKGKDCGHIFYLEAAKTSIILKTINDNCNQIPIIDAKVDLSSSLEKENRALVLLSDELCLTKEKEIYLSSIDLLGKNELLEDRLNNNTYRKTESRKYEKIQNLAELKDSILLVEILERRKQNKTISKKTKSTADLYTTDISNKHQTAFQSVKNANNISRSQVDLVLFNLLLEDLKVKRNIKLGEVKAQYIVIKKVGKSDKEKKRDYYKFLKKLKWDKKKLDKEIENIQAKIKVNEKLIAKKEGGVSNDFMFDNTKEKEEIGLVYRIQIGVYKNKISKEIFKGLSPVYEESYIAGVRYSVGAFEKLTYAKQAREHIVSMGLKDAFIVSFYNGEKINIKTAIAIEQ